MHVGHSGQSEVQKKRIKTAMRMVAHIVHKPHAMRSMTRETENQVERYVGDSPNVSFPKILLQVRDFPKKSSYND